MKINGNDVKVEVVYTHPDGEYLIAYRTLTEVLESSSEEILESCEAPCTSGSCFTESQNHCDCDGAYYDHEFHEIRIDTEQFQPKWIPFEEWADTAQPNTIVDTYSDIYLRVPDCEYDGESIEICGYDYYPGETKIWVMEIVEPPKNSLT